MNSRMNWLAVSAAVLAVSALSSCAAKPLASEAAPAQETVPVTIDMVDESSFSVLGEYYGVARPVSGATLIAPAGGRVEYIRVGDGAKVRKGDSLGGVSIAKAEAQYRTAQLNERMGGEVYQRQKDFFATGAVSRLAVDQAELAWNGAKSALLQADEILRGARCESPLDGTVLSRRVDLYDELAPGSPTFSVGDLSRLEIEIGIPESDIAGANVGAAASISFSAFPGENFRGTLTRIDRELSSRTLTFRASVVMDNPAERVLPGVTAKVSLPRSEVENAIVVPTPAVLSSSEGPYVMVARKEGSSWIARRLPVSTGVSDADSVVVSGGLTRGDYLIVEGNHLAEDGAGVSFDERLAMAGGVAGK